MSVKIKKYGDPKKAVDKANDLSMLEIAIMVTNQAKQLAPTDTGQLRSSIMWIVQGKTGGHEGGKKLSISDKVAAYVGTAVEYAGYQEFGTKRMPAQPFLLPAIEIVVLKRNVKEVIAKLQRKEMKKESK